MNRKIDWESRIGRRLQLRDLHVFFAAAQCGSLAAAARQLGVSQPTVSEIVAGLENTFGVRLLDRSPQGVEPTIYGEALLRRGHAAFDELKQSARDIEFLSNPTTGEVRIGCSEAVTASILPPMVHRFAQQYPGVVVYVNHVATPTHIRTSVVRDRTNDLVLGMWPKPHPDEPIEDDLKVEPLFDDRLVVAAGKRSRWAERHKIDLAELLDERWVMAHPTNWSYVGILEAFRARGLTLPKSRMVTISAPLRAYLLSTGDYIAAIPGHGLESIAGPYGLMALPVELPERPRSVAILTLKNRTLSPIVQRFIQCARDVAKSIVAKPDTSKPRPPSAHDAIRKKFIHRACRG